MSILAIIPWPDARLSAVCDPVTEITGKTQRLARDMLETMYAASGRGLAAPQVGILCRMFVMDAAWKTGDPVPEIFINPRIMYASAVTVSREEGCLSIPGVVTMVARPETVGLRWTDLTGRAREQEFSGVEATCVQHELDHLDGIVTLDRLEAETRARVLKADGAVRA